MSGEITRKKLDGFALELVRLLNDMIRERTGRQMETVRRYAKHARNPLTSTVLNACRANRLDLVIERYDGGTLKERYFLQRDPEAKRVCIRLRDRIQEVYPRRRMQLFAEQGLPRYRLDDWCSEDCTSPRFGELVRLAAALGYHVCFFDETNDRFYEVF